MDNITILLVEDDQFVQATLKILFQKAVLKRNA